MVWKQKNKNTCSALDYRSFPIRIPATPRNKVRLSRSPPRKALYGGSIFLLLWQLLLTKPAVCPDDTFIKTLSRRTSARTQRIRGCRFFKHEFVYFHIQTQTRDTVGPMFDAWVVGLCLEHEVCVSDWVCAPPAPFLSDGLCGLLLLLSLSCVLLKLDSLRVFISSSLPRLLSPAARAVSRPCTSQRTTATSTWPRCCSTEGLPSTSWLGWVYSALCCLGVVLPALRVNKHRRMGGSRAFLKMWFPCSWLFVSGVTF